ncbi:MAG: ATP-binding cassette domain-containing protein, partial [Acidimicrobiales bacterium]
MPAASSRRTTSPPATPGAARPTSGGAASLVARHIGLSRGAEVVLDDVGLTVGPASRIGVVGPNGVGKTTLLRVLAGLQRPDAGTVTLAPPTATVGYLAQEPDLVPGETLAGQLARRTGVARAVADLDATATALSGPPLPPAGSPPPESQA